ncbi:hypothetical protein N9D70_02655, partial [bacterium]|nr:hypothetical protein [bacterium]
GLVLHYGQNGSGTSSYRVNAPIDLASTGSFKTKNGAEAEITHTIITALGDAGSTTGTDLQGMNGALGGNYVLGADIDASATSTSDWNDGKGFAPVGDFDNSFTGTFDGLGHVIKKLTIKNPVESEDYALDAGLFGAAEGASIQNVGLTDVDISGTLNDEESTTGGLAGYIYETYIGSSFVTGKVNGHSNVGGLVGYADSGSISNSYSTAHVSGMSAVGGLIGYFENNTNQASPFASKVGVFTSYAAGTGSPGNSSLVGKISDTSLAKTSKGLTSDTNAKNLETYQKEDLDFDISADGNDDSVWRIYEGQSAPLLRVFMKKYRSPDRQTRVNMTAQQMWQFQI